MPQAGIDPFLCLYMSVIVSCVCACVCSVCNTCDILRRYKFPVRLSVHAILHLWVSDLLPAIDRPDMMVLGQPARLTVFVPSMPHATMCRFVGSCLFETLLKHTHVSLSHSSLPRPHPCLMQSFRFSSTLSSLSHRSHAFLTRLNAMQCHWWSSHSWWRRSFFLPFSIFIARTHTLFPIFAPWPLSFIPCLVWSVIRLSSSTLMLIPTWFVIGGDAYSYERAASIHPLKDMKNAYGRYAYACLHPHIDIHIIIICTTTSVSQWTSWCPCVHSCCLINEHCLRLHVVCVVSLMFAYSVLYMDEKIPCIWYGLLSVDLWTQIFFLHTWISLSWFMKVSHTVQIDGSSYDNELGEDLKGIAHPFHHQWLLRE